MHITRNRVRQGALLSTLALAMGLANPAWADASAVVAPALDSAEAIDSGGSSGGEILVTGARASNRTVANSAAPIDVIDAGVLTNAAQPNLLEALNVILPSFNLPARLNPDLGSIIRTGQLRNLDPSYTLILVNGKRRHSTAYEGAGGFAGSVAPDLGLIPQGSISRVEVLRDGASAIYGSDAIAGVINIILREDTGFTASTQAGQSNAGDGRSGNIRAGYGVKLGEKGYLRVDGEWDFQDIAIRNFPLQQGYLLYPAYNSSGQLVKLGTNDALPAGATANPAEATRNNSPWINSGVPRSRTVDLSFNSRYDFNDAISGYAFGTWSHRDAQTAENFRPANTVFTSDPALLALYPNGFTPYETTNEADFEITAGIKGTLGGWEWDLSNTYGKDSINAGAENTANYSEPVVNGTTQTKFYVGNSNYERDTANFDVHRTLNGLFADPSDLSFGLEYSHEHAEQNPGEPSSYFGTGSSSIVGYLPVDQTAINRHNFAGYVGLSVKPTHKLLIDLAGRVEHYSDFGTNVSGRLSARYDFNPVFAVRGTISNGFHAPALVTEAYSNTNDHAGTPFKLAPATSAAALALGASPLQPEKSRNLTAGFTVTPSAHLRLAVDFYQINVNNRLGQSSSIGVYNSSGNLLDGAGNALTGAQALQLTNLLTSAGIPVFQAGSLYAQGIVVNYFRNVGNTSTRGVDITLDGDQQIGPGKLRWNLGANFQGTHFTSITPLPAILAGLPDIAVLSASGQSSITNNAPKDKERLGLSYEVGEWTLNVNETRYGPLTRLNSVNNTFYSQPAQFITDVSADLRVTKAITLSLGSNNVFNQKANLVPAYARTAASIAQYTAVYDTASPVGVLGGYYYARVGVKFR